MTTGAERNLQDLLNGALQGQKILTSQSYEIHNAYESGDTVILEVSWEGVLALPVASLGQGNP